MQRLAGLVAVALALGIAASRAPGRAPKPTDDVSVKMKVSDGATVGPLATITVKNLGTNSQNGVIVRVHAESEQGLLLWSGTVDLLPGKSSVVSPRVYLDQDTTALVATATLDGPGDGDPSDNAARVGLALKGKAAQAVVGRAVHLAYCASCHADTAFFQGKSSAQILSGANDPPKGAGVMFNKTDVKNLLLFYKNPGGVVLPPPLPEPPAGGWPTYAGSVKAILDDRCANCHGGNSADAGIWLDTYGAASRNAGKSLGAVRTGKMPETGPNLTQQQVQSIADWITGGSRP